MQAIIAYASRILKLKWWWWWCWWWWWLEGLCTVWRCKSAPTYYVQGDDHNNNYTENTAREAGAAANHAATNKNTKYSQLSHTHLFVPVAIETGGTWHHQVRWNWDRRLEVGRPTLQAMPESPLSCSSSCTWHYRGGMWTHFKICSQPASSLQTVASFS